MPFFPVPRCNREVLPLQSGDGRQHDLGFCFPQFQSLTLKCPYWFRAFGEMLLTAGIAVVSGRTDGREKEFLVAPAIFLPELLPVMDRHVERNYGRRKIPSPPLFILSQLPV